MSEMIRQIVETSTPSLSDPHKFINSYDYGNNSNEIRIMRRPKKNENFYPYCNLCLYVASNPCLVPKLIEPAQYFSRHIQNGYTDFIGLSSPSLCQ